MTAAAVLPHTPWTRVRTVVNWINLSTLVGLAIARLGGATVEPRGRGTYLAHGYRFGFPVASAFTVGSVIISKHDLQHLLERSVLLQHEDRHCTQYAFLLGLVMLPLYFVAVGVSYALAGDHSSYNPFERLARLSDGGYPEPTMRFSRPRRVATNALREPRWAHVATFLRRSPAPGSGPSHDADGVDTS